MHRKQWYSTSRRFGIVMQCAVICLLVTPKSQTLGDTELQPSSTASELEFETIKLKSGLTYEGLLQSKDDTDVTFVQIFRRPGKPMSAVARIVPVDRVKSYQSLDVERRKELEEQVHRMRHRVAIEADDIEQVELRVASEVSPLTREYVGSWFRLSSTADDESTRRCVVRIAQIFRAYRQFLPPNDDHKQPIHIILYGSIDEYQTALRTMGIEIDNLALYAARDNTIFAGTELVPYSTRLAETRKAHERLLQASAVKEREFRKQLKSYSERLAVEGFSREQIKAELARRNAAWKRERLSLTRRISETNRRNDTAFNEVTASMFRRLYHEAFHAYLDTCIVGERSGSVDRWLNEGMAQVFESAQLDGDSLRIDAPNLQSLDALKASLRGDYPLTLAGLLASDDRQFLAFHDRAATRQHYAHAWGVAHYLMVERRSLTPSTLAKYLGAADTNAVQRFAILVDEPFTEFELQWRSAMLALQVPE